MNIKETIEIVKDVVQERISSPILGSFAFFFISCNWKTAIILLRTEVPIEQAIDNIEETRMTWFHGFILPAILAVMFCLVYPWIKYLLSWYTDNVDAKRIQKRQKIELKLIESKKEIIVAEGVLEEIRENRVREAERRSLEFEYELKTRSGANEDEKEYRRVDRELEIEKRKRLEGVEIDREVHLRRRQYGLDAP